MKFSFPIWANVRKSWPVYKSNFGMFLLLMVASALIQMLSSRGHNIFFSLVASIASITLSYIWIKSSLDLIDHNHFSPFSKASLPTLSQFWDFFKTTFLMGLFIGVGFLLFILPGLYIAGRLIFAPYLSVEKAQGARKSLRECWDMTKGHGWDLLGRSISIALFNLLGVICLLIGLVVTVPISRLLITMMYREFTKFKSLEAISTPSEAAPAQA